MKQEIKNFLKFIVFILMLTAAVIYAANELKNDCRNLKNLKFFTIEEKSSSR